MQTYHPHSDVFENPDSYMIISDLPGVTSDKLKLIVEGGQLRLEGDAPEWRFARAFRLPREVDGDHIKAELRNGVLSVQVPKRSELRPRRIPIAES